MAPGRELDPSRLDVWRRAARDALLEEGVAAALLTGGQDDARVHALRPPLEGRGPFTKGAHDPRGDREVVLDHLQLRDAAQSHLWAGRSRAPGWRLGGLAPRRRSRWLGWARHRTLPAGPRNSRRARHNASRLQVSVTRAVEESNRRMLRARDAMDRDYAKPLDIPALARIAYVSEAHFIRVFRATFGETPHRYLQRRRVERAMYLLRETDRSVTEICFDVGFASLGTFSRTFTAIVGEPPTTYRRRAADLRAVPACFMKAWTRPSSFGEARTRRERLISPSCQTRSLIHRFTCSIRTRRSTSTSGSSASS